MDKNKSEIKRMKRKFLSARKRAFFVPPSLNNSDIWNRWMAKGLVCLTDVIDFEGERQYYFFVEETPFVLTSYGSESRDSGELFVLGSYDSDSFEINISAEIFMKLLLELRKQFMEQKQAEQAAADDARKHFLNNRMKSFGCLGR
jgi:hypothetical protein